MDSRDDVAPQHSHGLNEPPSPAPAHGGAATVPFGGGRQQGTEMAVRRSGRPIKYPPRDAVLGLPAAAPSPSSPGKRRGRPPGQPKILETPRSDFTPHVILVPSGEDIVSKIIDFARRGSVCVLSATGFVANVSLRQNVATVTEIPGCFEILSLSGSFLASESNSGGRSGILMVLLASSSDTERKIFGGYVGERLVAASPVQVVMVTFVAEEEEKNDEGGHLSGYEVSGSSSTEKGDGGGGSSEGSHFSGDNMSGSSSSIDSGEGSEDGTDANTP